MPIAVKPAIVIDTNVIVAGFRSNRGASFDLLNCLEKNAFEILASVPLICEYEDVLKRPSTGIGLVHEEIDEFLNTFCELSRQIVIYFKVESMEPDPDDNRVLEVAVAGQADVIVTFSKRHFAAASEYASASIA